MEFSLALQGLSFHSPVLLSCQVGKDFGLRSLEVKEGVHETV